MDRNVHLIGVEFVGLIGVTLPVKEEENAVFEEEWTGSDKRDVRIGEKRTRTRVTNVAVKDLARNITNFEELKKALSRHTLKAEASGAKTPNMCVDSLSLPTLAAHMRAPPPSVIF